MDHVSVRPVTQEDWEDFVGLFETKGGPHFCWCTLYRVRAGECPAKADKRAFMRDLVSREIPIGVLAYEGAEPVGWCSVAPRETYARLARSRTMPRATPEDTPTWSILCLFVPRSHRGRGIAHALVEGAYVYAKERGAEVVEGYPHDMARTSATHRGHSRLFQAAGFQADGPRWWRR